MPSKQRPKKYGFWANLLTPFWSILHASEILLDGIVDFFSMIKNCFARGPMTELKEYSQSIAEYLERKGLKKRPRE